MVLETLDRAVRQENEIKEIQTEEIKLALFVGDMILYIRDSQNSTRKLLERISDFSGRIQDHLCPLL